MQKFYKNGSPEEKISWGVRDRLYNGTNPSNARNVDKTVNQRTGNIGHLDKISRHEYNSEMIFTESDMDIILDDDTKVINGDIRWQKDEDHSPTIEFFASIDSESGYPLNIRGSFNAKCQKLGFSMILGGNGRIYGLDIGTDHRNPKPINGNVGKLHKHKWKNDCKDKFAYCPNDITVMPRNIVGEGQVVQVWKEFCTEAKIIHYGTLEEPSSTPLFDTTGANI